MSGGQAGTLGSFIMIGAIDVPKNYSSSDLQKSSGSGRQRAQSLSRGYSSISVVEDSTKSTANVEVHDHDDDLTICDAFAYQNFQRDNRVDRYLVTIKNWVVPQNMRLDAAERWAAAGSPGTKKNFETTADKIRSANTTDILFQLQVTWLLHPTGWDNELIQHDEKRCSSHLDVPMRGNQNTKAEPDASKGDNNVYSTIQSTASSKGGEVDPEDDATLDKLRQQSSVVTVWSENFRNSDDFILGNSIFNNATLKDGDFSIVCIPPIFIKCPGPLVT
jgi:hypothetical protein